VVVILVLGIRGGRAPLAAGRRPVDDALRHTYQLHWNDGATQLHAVCEAPACAQAARAALGAYLDTLTR